MIIDRGRSARNRSMASFGATSTADQVLEGIDLRGKHVLVTGVSSGGMGSEIARTLVAHGANVTGTARDMAKGRTAAEEIRSQSPQPGSLQMVQLDLASLTSVRTCAEALLAEGKPLDAIIANAGVMAGPKRITADGFEMQFGTNHLGHFALINRIAPLLSAGSRVACVSSAGHRRSDVDLHDLNFRETPYDELLAYGRSKTAVILFAVEFDRRHRGSGIRAAALHPGAVRTEIVERMIEERRAAGTDPTSTYDWKTVPQGAATAVWTAVVAQSGEVGGSYCENCHVAPIDDDPGHSSGVRSYALNLETAGALWAKSEEMVGERF